MRMIDMSCPHCGAKLQIELNESKIFCEYCDSELLLAEDNQRLNVDQAEDAGYQFEKGRQRAQQELSSTNANTASKVTKKKGIFWWVIGWIFIFPLPLTILLSRNKNMNMWLRIALIIVAWAVYLLIGFSGSSN